MPEKWTMRDAAGEINEFALSTIVRFAERGLFDASATDVQLRRPGEADWQVPSQVPELASALAARGARIPQKGGRLWTVSFPGGRREQIDLDQLLDQINQRKVTASTLVAPPARQKEFRPAADWPIFWRKFGTTPYVLKFADGSEQFAENEGKLRRWLASGRVDLNTDVYDVFEGEWVKASVWKPLLRKASSQQSGCLGIVAMFFR